tara:strand:+ start:526 stop:846 length:321 start_codon:yes stop_codon:yes gene_type:complete
MSQQEAYDELAATMKTARLASQHSSELMEDTDQDKPLLEDPDEEDPDEEDPDAEEEEYVAHDPQAQGILSYDDVHKQLSTSVAKTTSEDPDYEYEGMTSRRHVTCG